MIDNWVSCYECLYDDILGREGGREREREGGREREREGGREGGNTMQCMQ